MTRWQASWRKNRFGVLMLLPALVLMALFMVYPICEGIGYSFTSYQINRPDNIAFIGLENYRDILSGDKRFFDSLFFTMFNAFCVVFIAYVCGLGLATMLNKKRIPGRGCFRSVVLLPWIISSTVTATNWQWILNERYGIVNLFLQEIGVIQQPLLFFARANMAQLTVIMVGVWKCLPFMTIITLAGMQSISEELYEAAHIDGAGAWRSFVNVTLPGIRSVTVMCTTLQFIWTFNNFDTIYLLTSGGPQKSTFTLPIYMYHTAFSRNKVGYSAAIAVIVLLAMLVFAFVRLRLQSKKDE